MLLGVLVKDGCSWLKPKGTHNIGLSGITRPVTGKAVNPHLRHAPNQRRAFFRGALGKSWPHGHACPLSRESRQVCIG